MRPLVLLTALILTLVTAPWVRAGSTYEIADWPSRDRLAYQAVNVSKTMARAEKSNEGPGAVTNASRGVPAAGASNGQAPAAPKAEGDEDVTDSGVSGTDVSAAETDVYGSDDAAAADEETVDIYARKGPPRKPPFPLERQTGDHDVILVPAARPLDEGIIYVSLDELVLWRAGLGVTDELSLEVNSAWGASAGLGGKYALMRKNNTAVSIGLGMGALTFNKHTNWEYLSLLYAKDFHRGAVHLAGHAVLYNEDRRRTSFVPEITAGGEVRLMRRITAIGEIGFGSDVLRAGDIGENTGFINLGLRFHHRKVFATVALVMPTTEDFLDSKVLGVPFLRIGGKF